MTDLMRAIYDADLAMFKRHNTLKEVGIPREIKRFRIRVFGHTIVDIKKTINLFM
jgi:hypothetical protein